MKVNMLMVRIGNFFYRYRNGIFPLLFLWVFIPSPDLFQHPVLAMVIGLSVVFVGHAFRLLTVGLVRRDRGFKYGRVNADDLIVSGFFSHCRNPYYLGSILVVVGMGMMSNNFVFFLFVTVAFASIYGTIVAAEEVFLENKYRDQYRYYMRRVNRWVPSLFGIGETLREHRWSIKRVLVNECNSTFTTATLCLLLIAKNIFDHPNLVDVPLIGYKILLAIWLLLAVLYGFVKVLKRNGKLKAD